MSQVQDHPLLALPKFGDGVGLHRVGWLMQKLGLDPDVIAGLAIVVTGSNGKGSTARICAELMASDGGRVGLFTSPHLFRFNERFQIDGTPIADAELVAVMDEVLSAVHSWQAHRPDAVGAFEAQFLTALLWFKARQVRWQVLEAGIGGRFDPVRLARAPVVGLVSLDLEHTELLGRTLVEIAADKMEAAPPGGVVVAGESALPFRDQLETLAGLSQLDLRFVGPDSWRDLGVIDGRQAFDLALPSLNLTGLSSSLIGRHQLNNHAVAVELCRWRRMRSGLAPTAGLADRWRAAIGRVTWPGRLELIQATPPVRVDVGHTPEGVKAALAAYQTLPEAAGALLVTGGSSDKNLAAMVEVLAPAFGRIVCAAAHHKGLPAAAVALLARKANPAADVHVADSMAEAVRLALAAGTSVYVAGGLFLAAEFTAQLSGADAARLRFF